MIYMPKVSHKSTQTPLMDSLISKNTCKSDLRFTTDKVGHPKNYKQLTFTCFLLICPKVSKRANQKTFLKLAIGSINILSAKEGSQVDFHIFNQIPNSRKIMHKESVLLFFYFSFTSNSHLTNPHTCTHSLWPWPLARFGLIGLLS